MTPEQASQEAWDNYNYEGVKLYSTIFRAAFKLVAEWKQKEIKSILDEILSKEKEIISSPIRFNGVHVNDIVEAFKKHGIESEINF